MVVTSSHHFLGDEENIRKLQASLSYTHKRTVGYTELSHNPMDLERLLDLLVFSSHFDLNRKSEDFAFNFTPG